MTLETITVDGVTGAFDVTDSAGLVGLAEDAVKRKANRSVEVNQLAEALHPEGTHICAMRFPHNDIEWRTEWLCRVTDAVNGAEHHGEDDNGEPIFSIRIWLDVSFDAWTAFVEPGGLFNG